MARGTGTETAEGTDILYGAAPRGDKAPSGPNAGQPDWPISVSKIDFSYGAVDYETENDYSGHDACGDEMCRCRQITDVTIAEVLPRSLAERIIDQMESRQESQKEDLTRFLRSKAGRQFKNASDHQIRKEYKKYLSRQPHENRYESDQIQPGELLTPGQSQYRFDATDRLILEQILQDSGIDADDFEADIVNGYYGEEVDAVYLIGAALPEMTERWNDYLRNRDDSPEGKLAWLPAAPTKIKRCRKTGIDPYNVILPADAPDVSAYAPAYKEHYSYEAAQIARCKKSKTSYTPDDSPQAVVQAVIADGKRSYTVIAGAAAIQGAVDAGKSDLTVLVIS